MTVIFTRRSRDMNWKSRGMNWKLKADPLADDTIAELTMPIRLSGADYLVTFERGLRVLVGECARLRWDCWVPRIGPLVCVVAGFVLSSCSLGELGMSLGPASVPMELPVPDPLTTPDQQKLLPRIESLSKEPRLSGVPEMSRLRRAPLIAPGDWMFCLRGMFNEKPGPYAVFLDKSAIVHYRTAVRVDGCDEDVYEPLTSFAAPPLPSTTAKIPRG